jgi:3',5'-cyclic AMP phosphodiesterase CpdA
MLLLTVSGARRRLTSEYIRPEGSAFLDTAKIPVNSRCAHPPCSSQVHVTLLSARDALVTFASPTDATLPLVEFGYDARHLDRKARGTSSSHSALMYFVSDLTQPRVGVADRTEDELLAIMDTSSWAGGTSSYNAPTKVHYGMQSTSNPQSFYNSPLIHHVQLASLRPGATVHYRVANDDRIHQFNVPLQPNSPCAGGSAADVSSSSSASAGAASDASGADRSRGFTLGLCADVGQTAASNASMHRLLELRPDIVLLAGDLSYADGYHPRWDSFGNLIEPLASQIPLLSCAGNHEVGSAEQFVPYNTRWRMPSEQSGSTDNTYYAIEIGPVHLIALNSYASVEAGSLQRVWLERALARVQRSRTPWLVVMMHAPFYCSNSGHVEETRLMRLAIEGLMYEAGVDVVLNGHVHAYERTFPTFDMRADECGPTYLTIGDGGNREGVYLPWREPQPEWSAYREASFGVGTLQLLNGTHAAYEWHRHSCQGSTDPDNINFGATCESYNKHGDRENGEMLGVDQFVLVKPQQCANRWRSGSAPADGGGGERGEGCGSEVEGTFDTPPAQSASMVEALRSKRPEAVPALVAAVVILLLGNICLGALLLIRERRRGKLFRKGQPPATGAPGASDSSEHFSRMMPPTAAMSEP